VPVVQEDFPDNLAMRPGPIRVHSNRQVRPRPEAVAAVRIPGVSSTSPTPEDASSDKVADDDDLNTKSRFR
jgi:hypothetical protein